MNQKISVCIIAKDEAENIRECLNSLPFADQIIVNDTGSTDGTQEIIRSEFHDVILIESEWKDDFSEARNKAQSFAEHDWILWIDADDRVPEKSWPMIGSLKQAPVDRFFMFQVVNTTGGLPIGNIFSQARMYPNKSNIRWTGPIHEQIGIPSENAGCYRIMVDDIEIYHTGYDKDGWQEGRGKRNLRMIQKMVEKEPSAYWYCALGDAYLISKDWSGAEKAYKNVLQYQDSEGTDIWNGIFCRIGNTFLSRNMYDNALKWYTKGMDVMPDHPEQLYHAAKAVEMLGDFDNAIKLYYKVLDLPKIISTMPMPYDLIKIYTFHFLIRMLSGKGRFSECVSLIEMMHKKYPQARLEDN